jgi:hypothetical protein
MRVACQDRKHRKDPDLGSAIGRVDKAVLDAKYHVTRAIGVAAVIRAKIEKWYDNT